MKKILIVSIIAATSLQITPIAAAPLDVSGDFRLRFQSRTGDTDSATKGDFTIMRARVNLGNDLGEDWRFYSRLAVEQAAGKPHNNGLYDTSGACDRWGVQRNFEGGSIKLGRQDVVLGQDGLALSTLIDAVGENNQLTGATVTLKIDPNTTIKVVGGRLGQGLFQAAIAAAYPPGYPVPTMNINANLYALQVNHKVDQRFSIGGTYRSIATIDTHSSNVAKSMQSQKDVFNTSTLFGNYYIDPRTAVYTEFGRSNADQYNFAAGFGIGHVVDQKNSVSVNYFKQDINSGMFANWGTPDFARKGSSTSWKGLATYLRHSLDKNTMLELSDYYEQGNKTNTANQFRINLITNF